MKTNKKKLTQKSDTICYLRNPCRVPQGLDHCRNVHASVCLIKCCMIRSPEHYKKSQFKYRTWSSAKQNFIAVSSLVLEWVIEKEKEGTTLNTKSCNCNSNKANCRICWYFQFQPFIKKLHFAEKLYTIGLRESLNVSLYMYTYNKINQTVKTKQMNKSYIFKKLFFSMFFCFVSIWMTI